MPDSPIVGAFPPINSEDPLGIRSISERAYGIAFVNYLAGLGRAASRLEVELFDDSALAARKRLAAIAESIGHAHVRLDNLGGALSGNTYARGVENPIISTGDIQDNWEPAQDLFEGASYVAIRVSGSAMGCTGIVAMDAGGTLAITASEAPFQIRLNSTASESYNRIVAVEFNAAGSPTFLDPTEAPAESVAILPGQTAVLVHTGTNWVLLGIYGSTALEVRRRVQTTTISGAGLLNVAVSNASITAATLAELRAISLNLFTPAGVGAVQYPGAELRLINDTGAPITIVHLSGAVSASLRVATPTAANVTWPPGTEARLLRDGANNRWRLLHTSF